MVYYRDSGGSEPAPARRKTLICLDALMLTLLLLSFTGIDSLPTLHMASLALIAIVASSTPTFHKSTTVVGFANDTGAKAAPCLVRSRTQMLGSRSRVRNDASVLQEFARDKGRMLPLFTQPPNRRELTQRWDPESVRTDASMIERRLPLSPLQARSDQRRSRLARKRWNSLD